MKKKYKKLASACAFAALASTPYTAFAQGKNAPIVRDAEYRILERQYGDRWADEDVEIDAMLASFREHLGTDIGGVSPDGAVRLATTDCHGESSGSAYVEVDGEALPASSPEDAATISAALRANVPQGEPA